MTKEELNLDKFHDIRHTHKYITYYFRIIATS